jgi:hypothetical protein
VTEKAIDPFRASNVHEYITISDLGACGTASLEAFRGYQAMRASAWNNAFIVLQILSTTTNCETITL